MRNLPLRFRLVAGVLGLAAAIASTASAEGDTRREHRLDRKGDRIEKRLDRRGDRIADRLERRGERIDLRLDRRGERVDRRLDRRASVAGDRDAVAGVPHVSE